MRALHIHIGRASRVAPAFGSKPWATLLGLVALMLPLVPHAARKQGDEVSYLVKPSTTGSMGENVYFKDITYTIRAAILKTITVSQHDPNVAYVGSTEGYLWWTTDGGNSWYESRPILKIRPFYGDAEQQVYFGIHRLSAPHWGSVHTTTEIGRDAGQPTPRRPVLSMRPVPIGFSGISPGAGGDLRVGASANVNFGIGLPGRAPRLQRTVRKFLKPTSGINMKQLLLVKGRRISQVRIITVHPTNPDIVWVCTTFGVFKSWDGGLNWVRIFVGTSGKNQYSFQLAVDPYDHNHVLLSTGNGVFESRDGGDIFSLTTAQGVGEGFINWIYFSPWHKGYVFAGTDFGVLRSKDHGRKWQWIYFTTFPPGRVVRNLVIDPFDKKRGYIGTHDGVYTTANMLTAGLEDWERLGGLQFVGHEAHKVAACPRHKGHLWALTNVRMPMTHGIGNFDAGGAYIWESVDGGYHWKIINYGNTMGSMSWFDNDSSDPDLLWVIWSRSAARMVRHRRQPPPADVQQQREIEKVRKESVALLKALPTLPDIVMAADRYVGTERVARFEYLLRSMIHVLVPRLDLSYVYQRMRRYPIRHDGLYDLPFRLKADYSFGFSEFRGMLTWDLSPMLYNVEATLFGRVARYMGELGGNVVHGAWRKFGEIQRILARLAYDTPTDLRLRLFYKLRVQEYMQYLDFSTGGYLSRYLMGKDKPSGWRTPYFMRRWDNAGTPIWLQKTDEPWLPR